MRPMLTFAGDISILKDKNFIFEPKLDGFRALCYKKDNKIKLFSRNENDLTGMFPEINISKNIKAESVILDGEIVMYDSEGKPNFQLLQQRVDDPKKIHNQAIFVVFDIIEKDGKSLANIPLLERKKILERTIKEGNNLQINFFTEEGESLWKKIKKFKLEGILAKRKDSVYHTYRSKDWIKVKIVNTLDAIILGYTKGKRLISSLALGIYNKGELIYIGKVGTGFKDKDIENLNKKLKDIELKKPLLEGKPKDIIWVKPKYVAEVIYSNFTNDLILRASRFIHLRIDKDPKECKL